MIFTRGARVFKRGLSLLLVVTMLAGTIPECVYAENGKVTGTDAAEINNAGEKSVSENCEETECSPTTTELAYDRKEELQGGRYALLSAGQSDIRIKAHKTSIAGFVYTNKNFRYHGISIKVVGKMQAGKQILLHTPVWKNNRKVVLKTENTQMISRPDIIKETDYKSVIGAEKNLNCTGERIKAWDNSTRLIYSKNGNININGDNITINAVIYAPNGTVNISADNFTLNGCIIAKNIRINSRVVNINALSGRDTASGGVDDTEAVSENTLKPTGENKEKQNETGSNQQKHEKNSEKETNVNQTGDYAANQQENRIIKNTAIDRKQWKQRDKSKEQSGEITRDAEDIEPADLPEEDEPPIALIEGDETCYRKENGVCFITLNNNSYSPDGNQMASELSVHYDSDCDGIYETACSEITENNNTYYIQTGEVGKYKATLIVTEQTENALKQEAELTFEVVNKAPTVSGVMETDKKLTIMELTDEALPQKTDMEKTIRNLTESGYDVTYKSFGLKDEDIVSLGEVNYLSTQSIGNNYQTNDATTDDTSLSENAIILTAKMDRNEDESVSLSWQSDEGIRNLSGYTLYRKQNDEPYTSISTWDGKSRIKVLNVYPLSKNFIFWMNSKLKNSNETPGKGLLDIDAVHFSDFNQNPEQFLLNTDGTYKYDVILFGTANSNSYHDLNEASYNATLKFIRSGRGVLFGHDTVVSNTTQTNYYLAKFSQLLGITFHTYASRNVIGSEVDVVKEGTLTSYPWKLRGTLTVPVSHSSNQFVEGEFGKGTTVWMRYHGQNPVTDDNFYLISKNNVAMIQTGHSSRASDDEKKILANTVYYLKQYTLDTEAKDPTAYDLNAPKVTGADSYFISTALNEMLLHIQGEDTGTIYEYYVKTVPACKEDRVLISNTVSMESKTGIKGFLVKIDDNPEKTEELFEKSLLTGEYRNFVRANEDNAYTDIPAEYIGKECYAHICAVDNAGNIGEQTVIKLDTTTDIYSVSEFFSEEADYVVLDLEENTFDTTEQALLEKALVETGADILAPSDSLTSEILAKEIAKKIKNKQYIAKGRTLFFETGYQDAENDPCYLEEIRITDGTDHTTIITSDKDETEKQEKTYTVSKNGIYHISVKVQDNPAGDNEALSGYRAWSEAYTLAEKLICTERPVITELTVTESVEGSGNYRISWDAYAPGKKALENKGISKVLLSWKKAGETGWKEGELPENPEEGYIYLIKAVAVDENGIKSLPKVAIVDRQKISMSDADGGMVVKNAIEILTLGNVEKSCESVLSEIENTYRNGEYSVSIKTATADTISFEQTESIRFLIVPDKAWETEYLSKAAIQKNIEETNAMLLYGDENRSLADSIRQEVISRKKDIHTGMLTGMEVSYTGKCREWFENSNYAVRIIAEYENAVTKKTLTSLYNQPFIPKEPGKYNLILQAASKDEKGNTGRYQGDYPVVTDFYVYERPVCKTTTTLTGDENDAAKIKTSVAIEKSATGKDNYIMEVTNWWKTLKGSWKEGELPSLIQRGETYLLKTVVTDANGISSYPYVEIITTEGVPVPDLVAPVVTIQSPKTGEKTEGLTDIVGSIRDDVQIKEYSITYDNGKDKKETTLYPEKGNKENEKLGAIDFSYLPNGNYTITVEVKDTNGNEAADSVKIINACRLIKLTNVTADETCVYIHGKKTVINELAETDYTYQKQGNEEEITVEAGETPSGEEKYRVTATVITEEENTGEFSDAGILSEEEVLFQIPVSRLESGIYTFKAKAEDTNGISTEAVIKAEITINADEDEEGTITETESAITLNLESVELVETEETAVSGNDITVSDNKTGKEDTKKETYVKIEGTYESTDQITETTFTLKNAETGADIPFETKMENGSVSLLAKTSDMVQGAFTATGLLKNVKGCAAYATISFQLTGPEEGGKIVAAQPADSPFPTITSIDFSEDKTRINIYGDRAGYEHTALTCEGVENGRQIPVTECEKDGIIGYMQTATLENGRYRVTLFVYNEAGETLGMITVPFTYTKENKGTVSDNTVSGNEVDKEPPVIEMELADEDYILTKATDLTGSIYDETELKSYTVSLIPEKEETGIVIKTAGEEVREGTIATIDTALYADGAYRLVVEAEDTAGNKKTSSLSIQIAATLKTGNLNMGFTDLVADMSFGTINLQRFYNSNNKTRGDYGYGWTMGLTGMTLTETNSITEGYDQIVTGSGMEATYHIRQRQNHDVMVHYGDGTSDRFKLKLSPDSSTLVPVGLVKVTFECETSQGVSLEIDGDNSAGVDGGILVWENEENFEEIRYVLTTKDNTKIYLTAEDGVYKMTDSMGNEITVDENGYHGEGNKGITLTRNEKGLITGATDGKGHTVSYGYDEKDDLVSFTNEAGHTVRFAYDDNHNITTITDPMGVATARNEYDESGRLTATIDADGNRLEYDYDVEGRTQTVKNRRGYTTVYTYDENGNILKTVDALGNATYNTYDKYGNMLTETDANGNTTSYAYDGNGNVKQVTAPDGTKVESTYTQENYASSIKLMDKTIIAMDYDEEGKLTALTDANGNTTTYDYNQEGKLTSLTDKIGLYEKITYDSEGNVASTTNGAGASATYTYDTDGNCNSVTISRVENGETKTFTSYYDYDKSGNIIRSTDNAGNVTAYTYDSNGNQTTSVDAKGRTIHYTYDDLGNMTATTYPDGTSESFSYDENGNITEATDRNGRAVTMTYDRVDRLTKKTYADGTSESYTYDPAGNLTKQISTSGAVTGYTYNERNLNTSITDTYGAVTTFTYDEAARLVKTTDHLGNETAYTYDDNGNITNTTYPDGSSVSADYDARNRLTAQRDAYGSETRYEYDGADRLTKVTDGYGNSYSYGYDGNGNLISVTDPKG
ncbi:MAG: hypothetical protein IJN92_05940, partial [Lachnospiraceae bacterium]|nr:hypothetical protein [Lachnospiraceae bacterium]